MKHAYAQAFLLGLVICASAPSALRAQEKAGPVFKDGQAQVVDAFRSPRDWVRHHLWVETEFDSDGDGLMDRVHVDVWRPGQTDTEGLKVPVIYETSPYFAGVGGNDKRYFWDPKHEVGETPPKRTPLPPIPFKKERSMIAMSEVRSWVPRGFAVVHSESPGTGLSTGCPTIGAKNESLAPKAVIDWLCGRAKGFTTVDGHKIVEATWCNGNVGMTGTSYNGTLPLAAATTGVDGLKCILPIAPNTSYYHYYRSHGLIRHPGGYMGEDIDVLFDFVHSGRLERRDYCNKNVRDGDHANGMDRLTGDYNDFWAGRDYLNQLDDLKAPVFMAHAFNDWNVMPEHSVRIYEALKKKGIPCMAFFHQGGHGGPPPFELRNKWFTHYLYGVDNDIGKLPRSWIVREGDRQDQPTPYPDYPHPDASMVTLHPTSGGDQTGNLVFAAPGGQGTETLVDDVALKGGELAQKPSEHRLLYATPTLRKDLHLSGTARIRIKVASSKPAANLSVWLVSLPWGNGQPIYSNVITRGWADPQNHSSIRESEPLEPGRFYELDFTLQPDDHVVPAGQNIGLMIFSSDREFTRWPKPGTELTVDLDATSIDLPVVGGKAAFENAVKD